MEFNRGYPFRGVVALSISLVKSRVQFLRSAPQRLRLFAVSPVLAQRREALADKPQEHAEPHAFAVHAVEPVVPVPAAKPRKPVIACTAEAYEIDEEEITLQTDIREDLSNQSMKMIAMLAGIEEELDVTIEIPEAGNLNTILEFVNRVKEKKGQAPIGAGAGNGSAEAGQAAAAGAASGADVMDEVAKTVIACAAEAYEVEEDEITMDTDIREDLSNQSMKMIAMLAGIEEELDVTIEIPEAGNLNTIRDFVELARSRR